MKKISKGASLTTLVLFTLDKISYTLQNQLGGPQSQLGGLQCQLRGPPSKLGGSRIVLGEPWSQLGGSLGGPQSQLGEPLRQLGGCLSQLVGPQSPLIGPFSLLGGTRGRKMEEKRRKRKSSSFHGHFPKVEILINPKCSQGKNRNLAHQWRGKE